MGMVRRRTLFEQPVIILNIVRYFLVVGALCVLPWAAVTSAQDVTSGRRQQLQEGGGGGLQQHLPHHRPLCPDGWVRGSTGGQSFKDKDAGLCLYLSPQALTWEEARHTCRAKDSVLLSLDTVLSVEDKLFPQYLKDKGVGEVWTGMHKDGGRQIWDEPGKGLVKAYRGSQSAMGEAKRGWTWDSSTFSDARLTCGLYTYSSDQPHSARRRRRDADTPSPGAVPRASSDSPGREDSPSAAGRMSAFKTFLSNQGMKNFASKMSTKPNKPKTDSSPSGAIETVSQARKKTGSTQMPKQTSAAETNNPPSDKTKDHSSGKKNDHPSDKHSSGVKDKDHNNDSPSGVKDKDHNNDSPSDDKNEKNDKNGMEKNGNSTTDGVSSDEEDNNHELTKRSTPSGHAMTTADPGELSNGTTSGNSTQQNVAVTPPTPNNITVDNTTTSTSISEDTSQQNDTSSAGLFGQSSGFSKELLDFFNTDSSKDAASVGTQPASDHKADVSSGDSPPRDTPPPETAPRLLSPQEFFHRFQTGNVQKMGTGDSSANKTKEADPTAAVRSTSAHPSTQPPVVSGKDALSQHSDSSANNSTRDNTHRQTDSGLAASFKFATTAMNTSTSTTGSLSQQNSSPVTETQPKSVLSESDAQVQKQLFGDVAASGSTTPITTPPTTRSTTPDSSSEESSQEGTTTSKPPDDKGNDPGLFSDSLPASTTAHTFQQHFGPSTSSANGLGASVNSEGPSARPQTTAGGSREDTTTTTAPADVVVDTSDELFKDTDTLTLPSDTDTGPVGVKATTPIPVGSGESTTRADSSEVTSNTDSAEVTTPGHSAKLTTAKDSREVIPQADSKEVTTQADNSKEVPPQADNSKEVTTQPDSREVTPPTDSKEITAGQTDSEEVTSSPIKTIQSLTTSADSREQQTTPPDSREDKTSLSTGTRTWGTTSAVGLRTASTSHQSTTRQGESSEELDHVTGASTAQMSGASSSKEGTTLAQLRGVLESMTPRPDHVLPSAGHSWMTLQHCQQRHQFVCAAKPVHDFTTLTQCDAGWLGHSLVSRCYRLVSEATPYEQAWRQCQNLGGGLASADTAFFANVTHLLLDRMRLLHGFASRVWIEANAGPQGRQCSVMEPQVPDLQSEACDVSLPYLCQKAATRPTEADSADDDHQEVDEPSIIMNMSSWNTQPLVCPVRHIRHQDTVIWFKDGQPIPSDSDDTSTTAPLSTSTRNPAVLHLNIHLLQRLGVTQRRMQQPALLQGVYWCRVWRHHPLRSVTSDPVYVRFQDVVTLQGFIKTSDVTVAEAAFFNEMGDNSGLPAAIGRGLQLMNDRIYPRMQRSQPFLSDVITVIQNANAETDEVEFRTYLCLSTGAMAPQDKGAVVDAYLKVLHTELVASEDLVRRDWNLSVPFEQAFRLLMTEMCPESQLEDESTGYEATFPSTPVNQHAVSLDSCDGMFTGYAVCHGDLMSGAYWAHWSVDMTCYDSDRTDTTDSDNKEDKKPKINPEDVVDTGQGFIVPSKPNSDLLDIDEVHIEQENVEDVTDRLADILDTSVELTDADVEIVADVIDRVSLVPILPQDVGLTLMKTVNRVLDTPLPTLQEAQRNSQASTRILQDLDKFSEKLHFGRDDHVRYVTPNVAMEVWNMRAAREPVIGLAAIVGKQADSPLTETRILTLSNRTWADLHLGDLDVAIELPDTLVSGDGVGNGRLSMAIYHKPGLFLSSLGASSDSQDVAVPELNSAIISATLASTTVNNLRESVKLIFRPLKVAGGEPRQCVYWDFTLPAGGGWSSKGCVYNGTQQGRDICLCDHLTNFAVLLDFYGDLLPVDEANTTALSIITIIGLSLSILGLSLTVITFIFFKKLRQGRAQQTLFHMSIALLCSDVILLVGLKQTANYGVCLAVAILLHYFILASFLWMLVEAVLQYLTFVKVLGTYISKYTLKTVIPAWTIPLIPVIAVLATDYTQYRGRRYYCWMSLDAFYYAFALPVGIIILFNIVTFIVIMLSLLRRPEGLRSTRNKGNTAETNIKAAFTIFVLLGLTWTFGYLAIADARLLFQYMFTICSSLQGFLIFVLLVARRRQFREQWRALCCRRMGQARGQKVTPTLSNSASSQSSTSSFTSSSRSRTSSGGSSKTLDVLINRADSNASRSKVQLSSKASTASTRSRQC